MPPVLWQIRTSIFSEKARFALDYKGIDFRTKDVLPGLHAPLLAARRRGTTVPALDLEDGRTVKDSTAIVAALEDLRPEPPLYPADAAARADALSLEDHFDEHVGHDVRRVYLAALFRDPGLTLKVYGAGFPAPLRAAAKLSQPVSDRMARRRYGMSAQGVERAHRQVLAALDLVDSRLEGAGEYLVGDAFSVADLTAAALLAPLVQPPEHPDAWWTETDEVQGLEDLRAAHGDRPAWRWVREMYRRHRLPAGSTAPYAAATR